MNKVSKGERLLSALSKSNFCELTEAGANYVRQRFDPYHDRPVKAVGIPDLYSGHTISRIIKKSAPFTAVSGGGSAPASPWDAHIVQTPICNPNRTLTVAAATVGNAIKFDPSQNASKPYGGLMVVRSDTGNFTFPAPNGSTNVLAQLSLTDEDLSNCMRITALGFEFIDTTAELYRQGMLTAYRQNEPQRAQAYYHIRGTPVTGNNQFRNDGTGKIIKLPPTSVNDAMNIPDTKQWKVAEGAYCSVDFNEEEIPMTNPEPIHFLLEAYDGDVSTGSGGTAIDSFSFDSSDPLVTPIPTSSPVYTITDYVAPSQKFIPINQSGVILSGINPLFSGTVNCIWYVECAPSGEDVELLTLASQSPPYDPLALKIIGALRFMEPICVKLRENYTGQWFFEGIRDVVQKVVPWLSNAQVVGNQVVKWIDNASTNDGFINPQSMVKGNVAAKVASEKKPRKALKGNAVPKFPGPAPKKRAFAPKPVKTRAYGSNVAANAKAFKQKTRRTRWIDAEEKAQANALRQMYLRQRAQAFKAGGAPAKRRR